MARRYCTPCAPRACVCASRPADEEGECGFVYGRGASIRGGRFESRKPSGYADACRSIGTYPRIAVSLQSRDVSAGGRRTRRMKERERLQVTKWRRHARSFRHITGYSIILPTSILRDDDARCEPTPWHESIGHEGCVSGARGSTVGSRKYRVERCRCTPPAPCNCKCCNR